MCYNTIKQQAMETGQTTFYIGHSWTVTKWKSKGSKAKNSKLCSAVVAPAPILIAHVLQMEAGSITRSVIHPILLSSRWKCTVLLNQFY